MLPHFIRNKGVHCNTTWNIYRINQVQIPNNSSVWLFSITRDNQEATGRGLACFPANLAASHGQGEGKCIVLESLYSSLQAHCTPADKALPRNSLNSETAKVPFRCQQRERNWQSVLNMYQIARNCSRRGGGGYQRYFSSQPTLKPWVYLQGVSL